MLINEEELIDSCLFVASVLQEVSAFTDIKDILDEDVKYKKDNGKDEDYDGRCDPVFKYQCVDTVKDSESE